MADMARGEDSTDLFGDGGSGVGVARAISTPNAGSDGDRAGGAEASGRTAL